MLHHAVGDAARTLRSLTARVFRVRGRKIGAGEKFHRPELENVGAGEKFRWQIGRK